MREKLVLIVFGLLLGGAVSAVAYPFLKGYLSAPDQITSFESVDDLRKAMLRRDQNDVKEDQSVSFRSIVAPHPSDLIMYDLVPGLDIKFQRAQVRTNSCGFRGPERTVNKAPGTYRIALLGDSFAFGWGVEYQDSFAQVLEDNLARALHGTPKVEVLNFGIPGYSTFQEVALFEEKALEFDPDAVLVFFVENDFGLPFFIRNLGNSADLLDATSFARKSWEKSDEAINQENARLLKLLNPNRALARLSRLTKQRGIDLYLAINPRKEWNTDRKKLTILNKNQRIKHLELREDFLRLFRAREIPESALSLSWDPHPSPIKHQILGELIAASMLPEIGENWITVD